MAATVHVVARFRAKEGREEQLKSALTALIAPTRREIGCYQYDLLQNSADPREFCFVERWEGDKPLDRHLESAHVQKAREQMQDLAADPPDIRRYRVV